MLGYLGYSQHSFRDARRMFTSSDIAGIWARQQHESGRSPGNISFNGVDFSSYSTVIASILTHKGRTAYVIADDNYSKSTSRHLCEVRSAIPGGAQTFDVPALPMGHSDLANVERILEAWQGRAERLVREVLDDAPNADYLRQARVVLEKMAAFAAYFQIDLKPYRVKIPAAEKLLAHWRKEAKKILARRRATPAELHTALVIEAWRVTMKMRTLARGAGIPIENYRVALPLKEPAIKAAIQARADAQALRDRLDRSAPSAHAALSGIFDVLAQAQPGA